MEMNIEPTNKNHNINLKTNQVEKTDSQKQHKYQNYISKFNHELHEQKYLLCDW